MTTVPLPSPCTASWALHWQSGVRPASIHCITCKTTATSSTGNEECVPTELTLLLLAAKKQWRGTLGGCTPWLLTSRGDHVSVYGLAKESLDGGLPNYQPTRLNGSGNFFFPPNKKVHIFSTFLFFIWIRPIMYYTRVYYWVSSWWANRIAYIPLKHGICYNHLVTRHASGILLRSGITPKSIFLIFKHRDVICM